MKEILCNICHENKQEIEFAYLYFKKEYKHVCKQCESQTKSRGEGPGEDLVRDLVRDNNDLK